NDQISPQIATDGSGGAIVTWQDFRSGTEYRIYAQHVQSTGVVDPAWAANGLGVIIAWINHVNPQIAPDGAAGAFIAGQVQGLPGGAGYDILAQHVLANGTADPAWGTGRAFLVNNDQLNPKIVNDGAGGVFITWEDLRFSTTSDIYVAQVSATG